MVWYGNSDQAKGMDYPHQNMLECYVVGLFFYMIHIMSVRFRY